MSLDVYHPRKDPSYPPTPTATAPDPIDVHVGARLRLLRKRRDLSQEQLASALGLTFQQVQKYEKGSNRISASKMLAACRFLGCTPNDLFDGLPDLEAAPETDRERAARLAFATFEGQALMAAFHPLAHDDRLMLAGIAVRLAQTAGA